MNEGKGNEKRGKKEKRKEGETKKSERKEGEGETKKSERKEREHFLSPHLLFSTHPFYLIYDEQKREK